MRAAWLTAALVFASSAALAQDAKSVDAAIRDHLASRSRQLDLSTIGLVRRAELTFDALSGAPVLGTISTTISAAQLPYYLVAGEKVFDTVKRTIEERQAANLADLLRGTLKDADNLDQLSTSVIEEHYKTSAKLEAWAKSEKLLPAEQNELKAFWEKMRDANVRVALKQATGAKLSARQVLERQRELERHYEDMNKRVANVAASMTKFEALTKELAQTPKAQVLPKVDDLSLRQLIDLAQGCQRDSSASACSALSPEDTKALVLRGKIRDAAEDVASYTSLYVKGGLEIAQNLGASVPDWAAKAVTGITSGANLVAGVASKNPMEIMSGLIGLTSLFRRSQPSAEMQILRALSRVDARIQQIQHKLEDIDHKLYLIIQTEKQILTAIGETQTEIKLVEQMLDQQGRKLEFIMGQQLLGCQSALYTSAEMGIWSPFFRHSVDTLTPNVQFSPAENAVRIDRCREFVENQFASEWKVAPLFSVLPGTVAAAATRDANTLYQLGAALGDKELGWFEPAVLPDLHSRTELVLRFASAQRCSGTSTPLRSIWPQSGWLLAICSPRRPPRR